jgi:hypothetical protein
MKLNHTKPYFGHYFLTATDILSISRDQVNHNTAGGRDSSHTWQEKDRFCLFKILIVF